MTVEFQNILLLQSYTLKRKALNFNKIVMCIELDISVVILHISQSVTFHFSVQG